jgi:hypothetical protein
VFQGDRNYIGSLSWASGSDPSDDSKRSACRASFGNESDYTGSNWKEGGLLGKWRPVCRWSGRRSGDIDTCCLNKGQASGSEYTSCPVGSNNPLSETCAGYWLGRCNSGATPDSNICRTLYERAPDKSKLRPFVVSRCFSGSSRPGDKFCIAAMSDPAFKAETATMCNSTAGFAANTAACRDWCINNDGSCDATMSAYCDTAGRSDPVCGCYGSNMAYDDAKYGPLRDAGMIRCAAPCTSGDVYVPASAAGITTCCSQITNLNVDQGRTFLASARADVNLSMQCGDSIRELKNRIDGADRAGINTTLNNGTGNSNGSASPTQAARVEPDKKPRSAVLYFIIFVIIALFIGSIAVAIIYFKSKGTGSDINTEA